jgi:hypothetical protein
MRIINAYTAIIYLLQVNCNGFATLMTWVDLEATAITSVDTFTISGCADLISLAAGPGNTACVNTFIDTGKFYDL